MFAPPAAGNRTPCSVIARHVPQARLWPKATRPARDAVSAKTKRLRNFACLCPPQRSKVLVYLKVDPKDADLVPGFTRDVSGLGHHGTGKAWFVHSIES